MQHRQWDSKTKALVVLQGLKGKPVAEDGRQRMLRLTQLLANASAPKTEQFVTLGIAHHKKSQGCQNGPDLCFEAGNLALDNVPNNVVVDPEILVSDDITERSNLSPFYFRMSFFDIGGDRFRRLSDHLKVSKDGVDTFGIRMERIGIHSFNISVDFIARL